MIPFMKSNSRSILLLLVAVFLFLIAQKTIPRG